MACQHVGAATLMGGRARRAPMALVRPIAAGWAPHARCLTFSPPGAHVLLGPFKRPVLLGARAGKKGCQQPPCGAGVHCRAVAELDAVCSGFKCGRLGWDDHQSPPSPSSTDRGLATIATATSFAAPLVSAPDLTLPRAPPGSPPSPPHARWRQHRRLRVTTLTTAASAPTPLSPSPAVPHRCLPCQCLPFPLPTSPLPYSPLSLTPTSSHWLSPTPYTEPPSPPP